MTPSNPTPKLPNWIFFLSDAVLLFVAWFIASRSPGPLPAQSVFGIVACVIVGAILGTIPLVMYYEREKNETLDDRQRALEALARTVADSAEQISIATSGLHELAELAQKNLRHAEHLPQKLQEKIAEFQAQLANARDDDREEMEKELAALRTSESDRLEATADKVHHTATELTKLEAAAQKNLAAAQAALARVPETIATASAAALAEIESKLSARTATAVAALEAAEVKRSRKPKPEEPAAATSLPPVEAPHEKVVEVLPVVPVAPSTDGPFQEVAPIAPPTGGPFQEISPVTPPTAAPFSGYISTVPLEETTPAAEAKPARKRAPRKPKTVEPTDAALNLGAEATAAVPAASNEFNQTAPEEKPAAAVAENVIASDGATRLLVTAYIGIGNRLFIRGEGPGLTWEKGVPLQFVSIGKWRWETADATAPVKFKLYKNDDTECAALGAQTLDSGHQLEVTATF